MADITSILGLLVLVGSISIALAFFIVSHSYVQRAWAALCVAVGLWGLGAFMAAQVLHPENALMWWRIAHLGVIIMPILYTYFVFAFVKWRAPFLLGGLTGGATFFILTNIASTSFITHVRLMFDNVHYFVATPLYTAFVLFFFVCVLLGLVLLIRAYAQANTALLRKQTAIVLVASLLGFFFGGVAFLPAYGVAFYPYFNTVAVLCPLIAGYAVYRHQFQHLQLQVVGLQLFVVVFWIFILLRSLFMRYNSTENVLNIFLLLLSGVISIYLVRTMIHVQQGRQRGERLARYLANANARLRDHDAQKTEFVSIASHQLRSPIAAIKGYSAMMTEGNFGPVPKSFQEPLGRIVESGKRIAVMVDDFLNVTRMEQGKILYTEERIELNALVMDTAAELRVIAEQKGLTYETVPADEPIYVMGDAGKLKQVFSNLIDNAIKYTSEGWVRVSVHMAEPPHTALIDIADSGIGVAEHEQTKLFQKFNRASNANTATVYGSGLGLYIAREILKAHSGWVQLQSDGVGRGATFTIELPVTPLK